jgi:hypothetical protein
MKDWQNKVITVSFQGTQLSKESYDKIVGSVTNVFNDLSLRTTPAGPAIGSHGQHFDAMTLHAGFAREYHGFREHEQFQPLLDDVVKSIGEGWHVLSTGHSLGGALATIFAGELLSKFSPANYLEIQRIALITFGSPRTGNKQFAHWIDSSLSQNLRVEEDGDVVPMVPAQTGETYWHRGKQIVIEKTHGMPYRSRFGACSGEGPSIPVPIPTPVTPVGTTVNCVTEMGNAVLGGIANAVGCIPIIGGALQGAFACLATGLPGSTAVQPTYRDSFEIHTKGYLPNDYQSVMTD